MSYRDTAPEESQSVYDGYDDEELPSYESCLSEFAAEAGGELDSGVRYPGYDVYEFHRLNGPLQARIPASPFRHPPEIPRRPAPPMIPSDTRPTGISTGSTVSSPVDGPPPPLRRETRPETQAIGTATTETKYGPLLVDGAYPSDTLCRLANALFEQLTPSEFLDPLALARASDPTLQNVVFTPRMMFRLTRFLTIAGIPFTHTPSNIPVLTRSSFTQWLVFEIRANPDYSYAIWRLRLHHYSLDPYTNSDIPRAAFPEHSVDAVLTNVHDVWRAIVHVLGKKQGRPHGTPPPEISMGTPRSGRGRGRGKYALRGREDVVIASERRFGRGLERGIRRGIARGILRGIF